MSVSVDVCRRIFFRWVAFDVLVGEEFRMKRTVTLAACVVLCGTGIWFMTGCDESGTHGDEFRVHPASVTLYTDDETVVLQAIGGHRPLEWTVSDDTVGTVSGSGQTVTYTRAEKNGVNRVTVTDSQQWTASATIVQEDTQEETADLAISPETETLDYNGDNVVFSASGGVRPYTWAVGIASLGSVTSDSSTQAVYTRTTSGDNTVLLTDAQGHVAIAEVSQP